MRLTTLEGKFSTLSPAAFSPDGLFIVAPAEGDSAVVWDTETGKPRVTLDGHTSWVSCAAFSPDGTRVVTTSIDETAKLWDPATGQ